MPTSSLAQLPDTGSMMSAIGGVSTPVFNSLLFLGIFVIGVFLAVLTMIIIINAFEYFGDKLLDRLFGGGDKFDSGHGKRGTSNGQIIDLRPPSSKFFEQ